MLPFFLKHYQALFLSLLVLLVSVETGKTQEEQTIDTRGSVTPTDVYVELRRTEQFVDEVSRFMGIPEPEPLGFKVVNAAPHDVYFQARSLLIKANRFSFEMHRNKTSNPPILIPKHIGPTEVKKMVVTALEVMRQVNQDLGISTVHPKIQPREGITPSEVFMTSMIVNRHLNSLLERRFSPSEVYKIVNMSIGYASNLLAQYPDVERIPPKPLYEKNKRPLDVYYRLHTCLQHIIEIYQTVGLDTLDVDISAIQEKNISPSDVFDMASIILARLDYLHTKKNIIRPIRETYFPGRKVPSDVYQQSAILEQQLTTLLSLLKKDQQADR